MPPASLPPTVLVVEDETDFCYFLKFQLEQAGYRVLTAADGVTGLALATQHRPALLLLDVMLPGLDGLELCRRVRRFSDAPILMVTAKAGTSNIVRGLEAGADDYVTKPCSAAELLARVKAHLRRTATAPATFPLHLGQLLIDCAGLQVTVAGQPTPLTEMESRLLAELAQTPHQIVPVERLMAAVWHDPDAADRRILRQTIYRLRQKIEADPKHPQYLQTRARQGYLLTAPDD
ncbi:MAG: response regulator transcription factor [Anaerolineae bacterium]|nr:response regulator transcription factor [Anaerolineae bacterium]